MRNGWLAGGLELILCLVLVFSVVAPMAAAEDVEEGCDSCQTYPVMHPDRETREEWIEAYNTAPLAYIEREGFEVPSPRGSLSLLDHLDYTSAQRNQGNCGNCWAWAGNGCLGIGLDVQEGIKDRLSMQYINSCKSGDEYACCGGWLSDLADFYTGTGQCIPWSNNDAYWQDGSKNCAAGSSDVACGSISTDPNYPITSINEATITTQTVDQATAIANIKNVLGQNKAVWFGFFLPTDAAWSDFQSFWDNNGEDIVYDMDKFCDVPDEDAGGHAVLCVGYNDDNPANEYWIMLNSWGTVGGNRPNGLFRIDMDMNYDGQNPGLGDGDYSFYWQTLDVTFDIAGQPDITVSPPSFDVTLAPDTTQDYTLTIGNNGGATLAYSISEEETTGLGSSTAGGEDLLWGPGSMVLEIPLERSPVKPLNAPEVGNGWQNIMTDGFEGAFPGIWDVLISPGSTNAYWGKDNYNPHTGSYSTFCAKSGSAGVDPPNNYPNNMEAWMIYGLFSLEDAIDAELNFYYWLDSEYEWDYLWCMASIDETNWYGYWYTGDFGGWVSKSFDLTNVHTLGNLCGESQVWIAFIFTSDHVFTDKGAFIDDVVLRQYVAAANNAPNTPSNPSPVNHATEVSINTDLSWTGGDPDTGDTVTYDVYFGTSASPSLVSNDQSATSYDPGTLSSGTKYYWKIVATDNHALSTTGPIWDFTTGGAAEDCPWLDEEPKSGTVTPGGEADITVTFDTTGLGSTYTANIIISSNDPDENPTIVPVTLHVTPANNPPNTPSNPSPADYATGVSINADLNWTGGDPDAGDTVTYDVYFGTSVTPSLVSNDQPATTYDPGTLNNSTKYYWRIVATDNHAAFTTGPLWDFTTGVSQAASVSIEPQSQTVSPSGTFDIDVWVNAAGRGLIAFDVAVRYNSDAMTTNLADIEFHNLLGGFELTKEWTEAGGIGEARYAVGSLDPVPGVNHSAMTIHFTMDPAALPGEVYPLTITMADLANQGGVFTDTETNDGTATVTTGRKGDFNGDGEIDIFDFVMFAAAYGSELGDDNYNPIGDFNNDDHIDIFDFVLFAAVYGT